MESLVIRLFEIDAIKFGEFRLKSGLISPIYLDLRVIIGYPKLLNYISEAMYEVMNKEVDQLCGVPYTAFPIASCISVNHFIPSVIKRKEAKDYGTKKLIEGVFDIGMKCCIIEDVITTGSSVIETARALENVGLKISEVIVLIDRCQGGRHNLEKFGYKVKSLLTIDEILLTLLNLSKISNDVYNACTKFINLSQVEISAPLERSVFNKINEMSWKDRSAASENKVAKRLFEIINVKKSSLCVAADVLTMSELLSLAEKVAPFISVLKIHADIINDFNIVEISKLKKKLSMEKQFLLMEDRKFSDIGNTVKLQLENKVFDYLSWCDLVTVHCLPGDGVLDGIEAAARNSNVDIGCVLIAEMSSKGSLSDGSYKEACAAMAARHSTIVAGFVSQSPVTSVSSGFIHFTPGVKLVEGGDSLGQNYRSVSELTKAGFVDLFIVGRGITEALCPAEEAATYCQATYQSH